VDDRGSKRNTDELLEAFGLGEDDRADWQRSDRPFDEWLTDRVARCPAGARAREVYGAEDAHDFARRAILAALALGPEDRLLEIGCGGGLLLRDALAATPRVTGLDHSDDMVRLARERAPRATVVSGRAEELPFTAGAFTAVGMSIVFMFLVDPAGVLRECKRVLAPRARLAIYTTAPELRGTPAAPEPLAAHCRFYADAELAALLEGAGLAEVRVTNDGGGQLAVARA
jgi:SAM-dependent methyltransferase